MHHSRIAHRCLHLPSDRYQSQSLSSAPRMARSYNCACRGSCTQSCLAEVLNRKGTEDGLLSDSNSRMLKWSIVQNKEKSSYLFSKRSFHRGFVIFLFKTSQLRMLSSVSNVTSLQDRLCNCQSGKNYCQIKIGKTCDVKSVSIVKNVKIAKFTKLFTIVKQIKIVKKIKIVKIIKKIQKK